MSMISVDKVHAEKILQQLWENCENEDLCDVVLIAGNDELRIPAHRNILSASSEYFKAMFQSSMRESKTKEIKMPSVSGAILSSVIEYCYKGHVQTSNCLGLALFAEQYRCEELLKKAKDFSLEHFMDVSKTQEFLNLNSEQLGEFLANDNLCVFGEENVFEILMTWIQHDQIERIKYRDQLLRLVRLPFLERSFLIEQVKPICTSMESFELYVEAIEGNSLPDKKIINARKSINSDKFLRWQEIGSYYNYRMQINFYCPQRLKWMKYLKELDYRNDFGVAVMNDNLYFVGGKSNYSVVLNTVTCINLKTMTTCQINPMTERRMGCRIAVLNEFLYAVGGHDGNKAISLVEKWDPHTNTWSEVASMSERRRNFGIAQLNDKLYAIGGYDDNVALNSGEYYDVDQNVWKSIAPMNKCREVSSVAVANGLLYAVGSGYIVERYDPRSDEWTILCSLPIINSCTKLCTTICNKVIVYYENKFYEYKDETNQWKEKETLNEVKGVGHIFKYSGKLPMDNFAEN